MSKKPSNSNKKDTQSEQTKLKEELKTMKKMDVAPLKQEIIKLRQQLKHLITHKIQVQKSIQKNAQQFMNDSYVLQKSNTSQQDQLNELQNKLQILKNTFNEAQIKKKTELSQQIADLSMRRQTERLELRRNYEQLLTKVGYLKNFKQRQVQYKQTLKRLQQRQQYISQSHDKDITKLKSTFESKRQQIKQMTDKEIDHIQSIEVNKLRQKLSLQEQIKRENYIMQEEIRLCEEEKLIVMNQCKILTSEITQNLQENSKSILGGQATETYERSLRVLKLEGKINKLKDYLKEQTARLQEELGKIEKSYDEEEKTVQQKIQKIKTAISLKERDYKKVKACSQMVLNQRSSLEAYLLEVFYENGDLDSKSAGNVNEILRKLFVKINSKKVPVSYKNYLTMGGNLSGGSTKQLASSSSMSQMEKSGERFN